MRKNRRPAVDQVIEESKAGLSGKSGSSDRDSEVDDPDYEEDDQTGGLNNSIIPGRRREKKAEAKRLIIA